MLLSVNNLSVSFTNSVNQFKKYFTDSPFQQQWPPAGKTEGHMSHDGPQVFNHHLGSVNALLMADISGRSTLLVCLFQFMNSLEWRLRFSLKRPASHGVIMQLTGSAVRLQTPPDLRLVQTAAPLQISWAEWPVSLIFRSAEVPEPVWPYGGIVLTAWVVINSLH